MAKRGTAQLCARQLGAYERRLIELDAVGSNANEARFDEPSAREARRRQCRTIECRAGGVEPSGLETWKHSTAEVTVLDVGSLGAYALASNAGGANTAEGRSFEIDVVDGSTLDVRVVERAPLERSRADVAALI